MRSARWFVGIGALLMALLALYVLTRGVPGAGEQRSASPGGASSPAMDEIDAQSREAMREILRDAGNEE